MCDAMTAIKRDYCKMSPVTLSLISGGVVSKQISLLLIGLPGFHQLKIHHYLKIVINTPLGSQ